MDFTVTGEIRNSIETKLSDGLLYLAVVSFYTWLCRCVFCDRQYWVIIPSERGPRGFSGTRIRVHWERGFCDREVRVSTTLIVTVRLNEIPFLTLDSI